MPYTDAEERVAVLGWWEDHVAALREEWLTSRHNRVKPQTWVQFVGDCLRIEFGATRYTVAERVRRVALAHPDLYTLPPKGKAVTSWNQSGKT